MRAILRLTILLLLSCILIFFAYAAGFGVNYFLSRAPSAQANIPSNFNTFWETWNIIKGEFYGAIPGKQILTHGAIRGMLRSLGDPNTVLVEPEPAQNEQANLQGQTGDVGLSLDIRNRLLVVIAAIPNSPSDKAGMKTGDAILKMDNKDVPFEITPQEASAKLRGPIGSKIVLTIHHVGEEKTIDVELTRERYALPTVESKILPNTTYGYIKISMETSETANEFAKALDALKSQNITAVILDLRNNPGGLFPDPVLEVSGQFLKNSDIVLYEKYRDGTEKPYNAGSRRGAADLPLAVLVNSGTASAAEILAGALQDYKRAPLIGEPTYGKGSVQSVRRLSDGAALHITTATWYTPKRNQIEGKGLAPDISVPLTDDDIKKAIDPQLNRAIDYLKKGS